MNTHEEENRITAEGQVAISTESVGNRRMLVATNVVAIISALAFRWPLSTLLFPYWIQSVIIGYYSRKRMLQLTNFSTEGFRSNGKEVGPTEETKRETAMFFSFHFGFFHAIYLGFLVPLAMSLDDRDWLWIALLALSFLFGHARMYRDNIEVDQSGCPNIGMLMFLPYLRIIPMHLVVCLGVMTTLMTKPDPLFQSFVVILFGCLKTVADYMMAFVEEKYIRNGSHEYFSEKQQ